MSYRFRRLAQAIGWRQPKPAPPIEVDCGWRWKPWPRFRVTVKAELGSFVVYEVYTDGREQRIDFFTDLTRAKAFGWAHRRDEE